MAEMSPLRRRMIEDMTVRNLSPATQRSYISGVVKFSRHFGLSPERLGLEDVRAFQVHLVSTGISWASLNQIVCALRFFYGVTLGQETIPERIPYAREPHKLPVVLSADEVVRFLEAVASLRSRTLEGRGYRQFTHGDPGRAGQGRQGSLRDAVSAVARYSAHLLAPCAAEALDVSRAQRESAHRAERITRGMPFGRRSGRSRQARHRACPAPQLCDASFGEWHGHPHHPGAARPRSSVDDRTLYAGFQRHDRQDAEPARSLGYRSRSARLRRDRVGRIGGGGCLPPPRRAVCQTHAGHIGRVERHVMGAITACRTAALGGHVEQCDDCGATRIAYNSCRN